MPFNRSQTKAEAKMIIARTKPSPLMVGAIYILLSFLFSALCNRLMLSGVSLNTANAYIKYFEAGYYDEMLALLDNMRPSGTAVFIVFLLSLVKQIVAAGFTIFCLNCARHTSPAIGNLLDGFGFALKVLLLLVLKYIFITLQLFLLVIPGVIAFYRYRQALFILIDDPTLSVFECLSRSGKMMRGHKWELFVLDLSFLLWIILSALPYVGYIVSLWLLPYIQITLALYYDILRGVEKQPSPAV